MHAPLFYFENSLFHNVTEFSIAYSRNLTLENCEFRESTNTQLHYEPFETHKLQNAANPTVTLTNSRFSNCTLSEKRVFIPLLTSGSLILDNCTFSDNNISGSMVHMVDDSALESKGNTYQRNTLDGAATFIYSSGTGTVLADGSRYIGNRLHGKAILLHFEGETVATIRNLSFIENRADTSLLTLSEKSHVVLLDSSASANNGTVLLAEGDCSVFLQRCVFCGNEAEYGPALYLQDDATGQVEDCEFRNNRASRDGSLYLSDDSSTKISYSIFDSNFSESGGAVFLTNTATANISDSSFTDNEATNAGALV